MSTPLPSPYLFACFPLQEYFVNKDTGFPLASGYVEFFADDQFTVPKDVYQYSYVAGTWTPVNLGSVLILSAVGTFQNDNGDDIIPYLFPFEGTPDNRGDVELYFIRVWSGDPSEQGSVLQFTRSGWPPNLATDSGQVDSYQNSNNGISNPEFSEVNFVVNPSTSVYTLDAATASGTVIAPGWTLVCSGTGDIKLKQVLITDEYTPNPSYAIQIETAATATGVKLVQTLAQSPRVYYGTFVSMAILAASLNATAKEVTITYVPSTGTSHVILNGSTTDNNQFSLLAGFNDAAVLIDGTANTDTADAGYVNIEITVPPGAIMQYTSLCLVTVQDSTSLIPYVQSTNAEQTNALFWYYKDQLEYKPIPSYALGWDFAMNPFQAQGTGAITYNPSSPGKAVYIADQTILFQNTVNSVTVSKVANRYIQLAMINNTSSTAIIQYLGPNEAAELLYSPVCAMIRGSVSSGSLVGQINLYYTTASIPTMSAVPATGGYSPVSAVDGTSAAPSVGGGSFGTWTKVNRSGLGDAFFTLTTTSTSFGFNGWDATGQASIASATAFAIVVSFADYSPGNNIAIEFVSLQKGTIPTPPAALSFGETLAGLQQYYEASYSYGVTIPTNTFNGALSFGNNYTYNYNGGSPQIQMTATSFSINYKIPKRTIVTPTLYSPSNSAIGEIYVAYYNGSGSSTNYNISNYTANPATTGICYLANDAATGIGASLTWDSLFHANAYVHWVADARYGIV